MEINTRLMKDIESYCSANELDVEAFVNGLLKKAFMIEKYGERPMSNVHETPLFNNNEQEEKNEQEMAEQPKVIETVEEKPTKPKVGKTAVKVKPEPVIVETVTQSKEEEVKAPVTVPVATPAIRKTRKRKLT